MLKKHLRQEVINEFLYKLSIYYNPGFIQSGDNFYTNVQFVSGRI